MHPLTLKNCVDIAVGRSPDLRAAEYDIKAAGEVITSARAGLLPSLNGNLTAEGVTGRPTNVFSLLNVVDVENNGLLNQSRSGLLGFGSVTLNYNLYKDGSIFGLNDAPIVEYDKALKAGLVWTKGLQREQVILIVAGSFLDAATRAARLQLDTRRVELCEQRLSTIEQQVQGGLKLPTDLEFARAQLRSSQEMLRLTKAQDAAARLDLAALLGMNPERLAVSAKLPSAPALPATETLLANASISHPGVGVANAVVNEQFNALRFARAQMYPQVSLNSTYIYGTNLTAPTDRHLYSGSVVVGVPIFDFGMLRANKRAAEDRYQAEKIRLEKVTADIRRTILDTYGALVVIKATAASYEQAQAKADTALRVARSQAQAGLVPTLTAIDAELMLIDAQEALNDQHEKELLQFATLQNATGGTWGWIR